MLVKLTVPEIGKSVEGLAALQGSMGAVAVIAGCLPEGVVGVCFSPGLSREYVRANVPGFLAAARYAGMAMPQVVFWGSFSVAECQASLAPKDQKFDTILIRIK
jgi:hypothetical protein